MKRRIEPVLGAPPATSELDDAGLRAWPLPAPDPAGDKESRGAVLVIGGSREIPGAVTLAGIAALRAGAGKLQIATSRSVAQLVAIAVPEARVMALAERRDGGIVPSSAAGIAREAQSASAVLVGPGMRSDRSAQRLVRNLLEALTQSTLILDAGGLEILTNEPDLLHGYAGRAVLTPHAGEMAHLLKSTRERVLADPSTIAREVAARCGAVVVFKAAITHIASPDGQLWRNRAGNNGLATSGSGDVLAGIIAGLAARGANAAQAACWGVAAHARAGDVLAERHGGIGFLAREIAGEVPGVLAGLTRAG